MVAPKRLKATEITFSPGDSFAVAAGGCTAILAAKRCGVCQPWSFRGTALSCCNEPGGGRAAGATRPRRFAGRCPAEWHRAQKAGGGTLVTGASA